MDTIWIKAKKNTIEKRDLQRAGEIIKAGGLVAFPTETVYGLGADGLNPQAVAKIFRAKGRPSDNPLILHISSIEQVEELVQSIPDQARILIDKFWPGALTLIFKKSSLVPDIISAALDTVAIRMPDSSIALDLIQEAGTPIAAPSANISGRPSPTSFKHVVEDMMGEIDMIIDGGDTGIGLESTVLDLSGDIPMILRPGGVTFEALKEFIPDLIVDKSILQGDEGIIPRSPGQKYRHYAPKAEMILFRGELEKVVDEINRRKRLYLDQGKKVGIMCTDQTEDLYQDALLKSMGDREDQGEIGRKLFYILREFDQEGVDVILGESFDLSNLGSAIMNRLEKAASGKIIDL